MCFIQSNLSGFEWYVCVWLKHNFNSELKLFKEQHQMASGHFNPGQFPSIGNITDPDNNGTVFDPYNYETVRAINIIVRPFLIGIGTIGNMMAFFVMQGGSLRKVSTCFYMSVLALVDTGKLLLPCVVSWNWLLWIFLSCMTLVQYNKIHNVCSIWQIFSQY